MPTEGKIPGRREMECNKSERLDSCDRYEEGYKTKERCDRKALLAATAAWHKDVDGSHFSRNAITSKGLYYYPYILLRPLLGISGICMMHAIIFLWAALIAGRAHAAAVFAHFLISNAANFTITDWADHIRLAQDAQVDAFALNIAADDAINGHALQLAFTAAQSARFKVFFSFDYVARGPWNQHDVIGLLLQYRTNEAYYRVNGHPFASTFEGSEYAEEWKSIKASTDCFFIPDWSSLGVKAALDKGYGIVDGLFSWAAWPSGAEDMNTQVDMSYLELLQDTGGLAYMMPVSPWFYTNLPGYGKNWLWRGDDLWYDRWQEVLSIRPEFVEIISWNDYGESHYIGPLHQGGYGVFKTGKAPFNYAEGMPHDGWRILLPFVVGIYKNGSAAVKEESLVTWYRTTPGAACDAGGTSANTRSHGQVEFSPQEVTKDRIYYTALLTEYAVAEVTIGGATQTGTWGSEPSSGKGIYHGSAPFNGATGDVEVTLSRRANRVLTLRGKAISENCPNNIQNWNAWVGSGRAPCRSSITSREIYLPTNSAGVSEVQERYPQRAPENLAGDGHV